MNILMQLRHPPITLFGDFLSSEECDALIELAAPTLAPSLGLDGETGEDKPTPARTSSGMFFGRCANPVVAAIEQRIADLLRVPISHQEGMQVLRYQVGQEYEPHYDYFEPSYPGSAASLWRGGQRWATVLMYLNTPERGGETLFADVQLKISPVKGNAVLFTYSPTPNSLSKHGGEPVIAGEKWLATKWIREGIFM